MLNECLIFLHNRWTISANIMTQQPSLSGGIA
jgi:hypothetical protein